MSVASSKIDSHSQLSPEHTAAASCAAVAEQSATCAIMGSVSIFRVPFLDLFVGMARARAAHREDPPSLLSKPTRNMHVPRSGLPGLLAVLANVDINLGVNLSH